LVTETLTQDDADGSEVFGRENTSDSYRATTVGSGNYVSGKFASTVGYGNDITASGERAHTFGMENTGNSKQSMMVGSGNISNAENSAIFGYGNTITETAERATVVGKHINLSIPDAFQFGPNNSGKVTILKNGYIGIGRTGTQPFESPTELLHLYDGNALFESKENGGEVRFYNNEEHPAFHNPSQDDIRFSISGANQRINGDLILSTGIGKKGQTLHARVFQPLTHHIDMSGINWGRAVTGPSATCDESKFVEYANIQNDITGTDGLVYKHKFGLHSAN